MGKKSRKGQRFILGLKKPMVVVQRKRDSRSNRDPIRRIPFSSEEFAVYPSNPRRNHNLPVGRGQRNLRRQWELGALVRATWPLRMFKSIKSSYLGSFSNTDLLKTNALGVLEAHPSNPVLYYLLRYHRPIATFLISNCSWFIGRPTCRASHGWHGGELVGWFGVDVGNKHSIW